ncbi:N-acetylmuramic acid 6-phosphate etherase [Tateyamaria pelophila]|uniref:N-acetylmuramic acid 6-phosphate etherase n=1 Tax=Tateyamaria pelophila TaxID=328415 RepID=UPI001CBDBF2D|nr:N-acetylmuramic acid 6-phosphate etherase [Tateyamaria pelophila]
MDYSKMQDQQTVPIDTLARSDALATMLASHMAALVAMAPAQAAIDRAAEQVATTLAAGATLVYAAAGSSGLMALADASELAGTFGIPSDQVRVCMAGGVPIDGVMPGDTEDDAQDATRAAQAMKSGDLAIVLSASGTTPYAIAFAKVAKEQGNTVVAIANRENTPLLAMADVAIGLSTGPEVLAGSTRLAAGTAQKVALNMISTQAGILLGHVHDGLMVNLVPDNIKLRQRALRIVMQITEATEETARAALDIAEYDTKLAVLIAAGLNIEVARKRLSESGGRLRACMPDPGTTTN